MSEMQDRPLVTFALFAYNQEQFIREAVTGAFAQTYEPLEIILSDDGSTDRTYEIMQEMAAAYEGPHALTIRQSDSNKGLLEHMNEVVQLVRGDIVVMAAGDDVSLPSRCIAIVAAFNTSPRVKAVFSDYSLTGQPTNRADLPIMRCQHVPLIDMVRAGGGVGKGATYAYHRACFFWADRLPPELFNEDRILPLRAALSGEVVHIGAELVRYRVLPDESERRKVKHHAPPKSNPQHVQFIYRTIEAACHSRKIGRLHAYFLCLALRYSRAPHEELSLAARTIYRICRKTTHLLCLTLAKLRARCEFDLSPL